jgi:hypothetical protein
MVSAFNPYNTLPVADEALDRGGVELLRVGLADAELFITLRSHFKKPDQWGLVLADITRHLADHYSADSDLTEDKVVTAVAQAFAQSLRKFAAPASPAGAETERAGRAKSARPRAKAPAKGQASVPAKSKTKAPTPAKVKAKAKPASKAVAGRKGTRR